MGEGIAPGTVVGGEFVVVGEARAGSPDAARLFEVDQRSTGQRRSMKLLPPGWIADPAARERFQREALVPARIPSEHVAEVVAAGVDDAHGAWVVTERLEGEDLSALLARGPLHPAEARALLLQTCHGLGAAHAAGIAHGDVRPQTIFVGASHRADVRSTVKILDFGVADVIRAAMDATSGAMDRAFPRRAEWAAPEQLGPAAAIGPRVDVWSLGLVAFAMLTGRPYWLAASAAERSIPALVSEVLTEPMPSASARAAQLGVGHLVPTGFDGWFARATSRDAALRYADASAAFRELEPVLSNAASVSPTTLADPSAPVAVATTHAVTSHPTTDHGIGQTLQWSPPEQARPGGGPLDLPPSLAQFAAPRPSAAAAIGQTQAAPAGWAPPPEAAPPYPGPYAAPMLQPAPHVATVAAPRRGLRAPHFIAMGAGALVIVGVVVGVTQLTGKPDRPRRSWDDDDDDPPRRRGGTDEGVGSAEVARKPPYTPVRLDLHVMSKCPFGVQVENSLVSVRESLGDAVDVNIEFIGRVRDGELTSLHGPTEVTGDLFQLCAEKHTTRWFDVLACQNKDMQHVESNWDTCAQSVSVPASEIAAVDACAAGQEGKDLAIASFKASEAAGASGSPTLFFNGEKHQGGRTVRDLTKKICSMFPASAARPAECDLVKPSPEVNVTILSDARCGDCKPELLKTRISAKFTNAKFTMLDYLDPAGAALWPTVRPNKLPAAIFDASADTDPDGASILTASKKAGTGWVYSASNDWNPECADAGGCALPACASTLSCRPETPGTLDLYMMSRCPFASKAVVALKEVMKNFTDHGSTVAVRVHFIGEEKTPGVLTSMHGKDEVEDDLRDVCVAKYAPASYLNYLACRAADVKDPWTSCTGPSTGVDQATIAGCATGPEGTSLLSSSFKDSKNVSIASSPTWIVNGRHKMSGIDAETIKTGICAHNTLSGCGVKLSGPPSRTPKPRTVTPVY